MAFEGKNLAGGWVQNRRLGLGKMMGKKEWREPRKDSMANRRGPDETCSLVII